MAILQVSQMLPLQLWDGQYGALSILPKSFDREVLCKTFTVAALGAVSYTHLTLPTTPYV